MVTMVVLHYLNNQGVVLVNALSKWISFMIGTWLSGCSIVRMFSV